MIIPHFSLPRISSRVFHPACFPPSVSLLPPCLVDGRRLERLSCILRHAVSEAADGRLRIHPTDFSQTLPRPYHRHSSTLPATTCRSPCRGVSKPLPTDIAADPSFCAEKRRINRTDECTKIEIEIHYVPSCIHAAYLFLHLLHSIAWCFHITK